MPDHELAMCAYVQLGMLSDRRQQALARLATSVWRIGQLA